MGGSFAPVWVAGFTWNGWQTSAVYAIIRFNTAVAELRFESPQWHLITEDGEELIFDIVVAASGILHHPKLPAIPGLESFGGRCFHSTAWDESAPIDGARVGIVGTGSTSAQIVGAIGERCGKLSVFQRTPQWIFPLFQKRYTAAWKWIMAHVPVMHKLMYSSHRQILERTLGPVTMGNKTWQRIFEWICKRNLHNEVEDIDLRAKLTPDYKVGCKRLVVCSTFYPSIKRNNVELVTEGIDRIEPNGVRTRDGKLHELDTLVLCTGFHVDRFILPVKVLGEGNRDLAEIWSGAPRAHRAMSVPGFPNLWFLQGPTGPVGNISLVSVSEIQIKYIIQCLDKMKKERFSSMKPKLTAFEAFNADLSVSVKKTIWATGGCKSWYIDASGDPNLYSHSTKQFYRDMNHPVFDEYEFI